MAQNKKLLDKAIQNPSGLSFADFLTLLSQCGWTKDRQSGSHQIWYSPKRERISVQSHNGMAKRYQVKQFLSFMKEKTNG